jgi:hypothetical protein
MELVSDKTEVKLVEDGVQVTRTLSEKFDAGEYLRRLEQLSMNKGQLEAQIVEVNTMIERFGAEKEGAEALDKVAKEKQRLEVEAAVKANNEIQADPEAELTQ